LRALHYRSTYSFLETFLLISVLSCYLNLNANSLTAVCKVAAKSFLVVRSNNNNKVLIAELPLDLLNKIEDSRDKCSFELVRNAGDLMPFRVLVDCVQSVLVAIVALFFLRY
jgi:hypothetical protein